MSGTLIEIRQGGLRVRSDVTVGCITLTRDGEEVDIPISLIDETYEAMKQRAQLVGPKITPGSPPG